MRTGLLVMVVAGCGARNPSSGCPSSESGEIACYSVPARGDEQVLDCEHPLDRTYWRVFTQTSGTAYLMPRPDAAGLTWGICDGDDAELAALFLERGLCEPTLDADGVEAINALPLADALAISHALHSRLVFSAVQHGSGWDVTPWALPEDLELACPGTSAREDCETYLDTVCGGADIGALLSLDEGQATALATALNIAYGVEG